MKKESRNGLKQEREGGKKGKEASSVYREEAFAQDTKAAEETRASQRPRTGALVPFGNVWVYISPLR